MKVGISAYGVYIPRYRISVNEIARVWGEDGEAISAGIGTYSKSLPGRDEDTLTISVEAAKNAMKRFDGTAADIGAVYVGSESHPFAVYPTASTVVDVIGASSDTQPKNVTAADLEFACKAGTAGMQMVLGLVKGNYIKYGLAIGTDCAQGRPADALEYTAGAGGAAFVIGNDNIIAECEGTFSHTTDTPDFWRKEGASYPSHGGRFTGAPSYFNHVMLAAKGLMDQLGMTADDFDRVTFHQPNARFPSAVAKRLGFPAEKHDASLAVKYIGNTYSGASIIGLAAHLDQAQPGERILCVSYGSGAGSDAFSFVTTDKLLEVRERAPTVQEYIDFKEEVDYAMYAVNRKKIIE
ncbi:MAG: hydroxymethylglutaryl-CoA synthase [Candidatus Heimdallarchaeota archaeon]|nr:hydroxymethylglutaryl-CoA synthase [Candidatus Heimdallarchaeota archaeon]MCK5048840.1 hydroxymethylglutaryl-CoA synthase [Candidatus Heimdallarchaeota archaeon]